MLVKVKRSHIVALVAVVLTALCYHSFPHSKAHRYNIRLNQDGQEVNVELSEADIENFMKSNAQKTKSEASSSTAASPIPQSRNQSQGSDVEFVVVNNKVYLKGEPIPQKMYSPLLKPTKGRVLKNMDFSRFKGEVRKDPQGLSCS